MARDVHTVEVHIQHGMNIITIGYVVNAENIFNGDCNSKYQLRFC